MAGNDVDKGKTQSITSSILKIIGVGESGFRGSVGWGSRLMELMGVK